MKDVKSTPHPEGNLTAFMITESDSFWSTHPSLDNRIKALEENYQLS
jgi:Zn-dependent protease with chaperone function